MDVTGIKSIDVARSGGCKELAILHCVSGILPLARTTLYVRFQI